LRLRQSPFIRSYMEERSQEDRLLTDIMDNLFNHNPRKEKK
jgi:hypothetical protein